MKILWISNSPLPIISKDMGEEVTNVEGWKIQLADSIASNKKTQLTVCFA